MEDEKKTAEPIETQKAGGTDLSSEASAAPEEQTEEQTREQFHQALKAKMDETRKKTEEAQEAMRQGKGRLKLEVPIKSGDTEITELIYDFTALNGMEYTDAMDSDPNAMGSFRITYRQALSLFAKAAAKQTDRVDMQDIVSRIGVTDAVEGVHLATLFFTASTRAGRLRISKM